MENETFLSSNNSSIIDGSQSSPLIVFRDQYLHIHGYLASVICVAGILGNLANIVVFTRPKMATSPVNHLLMMVAIADLATMLLYLPMAVVIYIVYHEPHKDPLHLRSKPPATFLYFSATFMVFCHSTAIWHTIAVASFRWLTLGLANGKTYCTLRNARILSVVLIVANGLVSVANWYTMAVHDRTFNNETFYTVEGKDIPLFNNWIYAWVGKVLPSSLLTILTILLIIIMRNAELRRRQLLSKGKSEESRRHQEHNRTTGMLLAVVGIFLLIELPHGIFLILMGSYKKQEKLSNILMNTYNNIGELIDVATLIAFSINFMLYSVMSRQFRITFFSLFCKRHIHQQVMGFRRLSTVLTNMKQSAIQKRSTAFSNSTTNTSFNYKSEEKINDNYLHPSASPLLSAEDNKTVTTVAGGETHSSHSVPL